MVTQTLIALSLLILPFQSSADVVPIPASVSQSSTDCTLGQSPYPKCFQKRLLPQVNVLVVAYGSEMSTADLNQTAELLKQRFSESTQNQMQMNIVDTLIVDLKKMDRDLTDIRRVVVGTAEQTSEARLNRLWYYYNLERDQLAQEIHQELLNGGMKPALAASDSIMVLSGPQFEGLGYANGGFGVTEQPSEIAWASNGGSTVYNTSERLVDELLHEIGHVLGLDHASARCWTEFPGGRARYECCQTSPGRNDVMSYCRDRSKVRGPYYFRYTGCTQNYLQETVLPNLLNGGPRLFQKMPCE